VVAGKVRTKPIWFYNQSGVIPIRRQEDGVAIMLITSRRRRRWIIPKGIVEPGLKSSESALKEAWEEAGLRGRLTPTPLGSYEYRKWGGTCSVEVFLMEVREVAERWPENDRSRQWFAVEEAARSVREADLGALIRKAPRILAGEDS
jgi:phosphohistidine phosphatase